MSNDDARRAAEGAARPSYGRLLALLAADDAAPFPDERLALMVVCAHPAIDPAIHTPLMQQTVLGLDAARIGSAFLVAPAAMAQRLVRAKPPALEQRLPDLLDAVYAAYGTGWDALTDADL